MIRFRVVYRDVYFGFMSADRAQLIADVQYVCSVFIYICYVKAPVFLSL